MRVIRNKKRVHSDYSAREVASVAYPPSFQEPRYLAVLRCFCDESYDKDSRIYTIGGFVARDNEWDRVSRQWRNCCLRSDLESYHASDVEGRYGKFSHLTQDGVIALNKELVTIIADSELAGWATSIVLDDFRKISGVNEKNKRLLGSSPYFVAMQVFLVALCGKMHDENPNQRIAFIFEEQEEFSGRAKQLYDEVKKKNPEAAQCMGSLTYAEKRQFVPLQLADKLAYEAMKNILNVRYDPNRAERIALTRMKQAGRIAALTYIDEAFLRKVIEAQP